jgi:hypothetical protein
MCPTTSTESPPLARFTLPMQHPTTLVFASFACFSTTQLVERSPCLFVAHQLLEIGECVDRPARNGPSDISCSTRYYLRFPCFTLFSRKNGVSFRGGIGDARQVDARGPPRVIIAWRHLSCSEARKQLVSNTEDRLD